MSKGTETRERIVARAANVFNVTGYAGTAISDIMRVTGLEKGGIYRHFASKDELALAAFDYAAEQVRARFAAGLADTTHAADALLAFVDVFRDYAQHPPLNGGCPILNTAIECDDTNPALAERAATVVGEWRGQIRTIVQQGIDRGEIWPEVDGDKLALVLIATLEGAVMLARLLRDATPLQQAAAHLSNHIETAIRQG
jgi:TetR/AcrR family transcriptional repressor of nem operon